MILVVSHDRDPHASRVLDLLRADGRDALLLDGADFPGKACLTIDYPAARRGRREVRFENGLAFDLADATAVWWRRPQTPRLDASLDGDVRAFTYNEWQEALGGLWQLLDARWMNPPARDEVASRKALQLRVAREVGLRIPETLITSHPATAHAFLERRGEAKTIYKTFSCTHAIWRETRLVGAEERGLLNQLRVAPVIFQEYIPAGVDLRVTVVGSQVFPAAIDAASTDYPVDFRMSLGQAAVSPATLPPEVTAALLALMRRLGLVYGAIDLRRTPEGDHVFLEVNTAGEFLFVEDRAGLPIARAIADWLATPE